MLSMFNKPFDLSSGLPSLQNQSGLFDRSSFSTQPLNLSSFRKFAQLTVGMILSIHLTEEGRIDDVSTAVCLRADMKRPVYSTQRAGEVLLYERRGAAGGCGRCGGSRVHAGSDLTLDSRAHVYAYTTPAAARRHRHRCLPALNTLNILHAHQLTERRRYPPTHPPHYRRTPRTAEYI